MMQRSIAAALVCLLSPGTTRAATLAEALCVGDTSKPIDPLILRDEALAAVPVGALNANGDRSVSDDELFAAATDSGFCDVSSRTRPCTSEARRQLRAASNILAGFWKKHPGIEIRRLRDPTPDEIAERPGLDKEAWAVALDEQRRFVELRCISRSSDQTQLTQAITPAARLNVGTFVLGKDIDSLTVERGPVGEPGRLKKVDEAEVSLQSNRVAKTRTVSIDGVAGLKVVDIDAVTLIPFVQYARSEVRDRSSGANIVSAKLGFGAVATAFVGDDQFDLAPVFARDTELGSELLAARLTWRPGFLYALPSFRSAWHFACIKAANGGCRRGSGLAIWSDAKLIGSFGTVLNRGSDPIFFEGRNFARVGGLASIHIYGLDGLVRDLSFDVDYKHLLRLSGDGRDVMSFRADVNWWVGGSENVALRYGYERSIDEDTLERKKLWKLGLGLRF